MERYLEAPIREDLADKMVFVGGPRQVGKTTMALRLLGRDVPVRPPLPSAYINWDSLADKSVLLEGTIPAGSGLVVLDEIHKYRHWRNLMKGLYDRYHGAVAFLVTGSARLDYYARGGDSLHGRYHYYRLHPLSLAEIDPDCPAGALASLLEFGGFPEPFLRQDKRFLRRWQRERTGRVVNEDLRDLERVREISLIQLLADSLPHRVGSPLSVNAIREDLQVSHEAVCRWLAILENMYVGFSVPPYGSDRIRAIKKSRKFYLWDWSVIREEGPRFENLVACQLLKYCHLMEDREGWPMELRYLRSRDGKEVDFVVMQENRPLFAVECKSGGRSLDPSVAYFRQRLGEIPMFYQVHRGGHDLLAGPGIRIIPFTIFCRELEMP